MLNNPFAKLFYDKFQEEVLNQSTFYGDKETITHGPLENKFIERFNLFLKRCGQKTIDISHHCISDKKLARFCSSLRFYMIRNVQNLPDITSEFSRDKDLISLFDSSAQYLINRSRQYRLRGKRTQQLSDIYDYTVWKVKFQDDRGSTQMIPAKIPAKPTGTALFVFDPNRCPQNETLAGKVFHHDMQDAFSGSRHEEMKTFFVHMPPSYPEEIAAANVLTTIRYPDEYTEADMTFAREQWSNYLGRNLKYNEDNEIISGYRYEDNDFVEAMKGLKIFGYCAAAADAHRCLKALKNLAEQIYEPEVVSQAMKNVTLMAYALMPLEEKTDYQGIYFMSNDINDLSNPEHVMMTNFPELYPQIRISKADLQIADSKITETAAGDFIIVSPMPESSIQMDKNGRLVDKLKDKNSRPARLTLDMSLPAAKSAANPRKKEWRDGHRLQNSTSANLGSVNHIMFKTVFNNVLAGKTGADIFGKAATGNPNYILTPAIAYAHRRKLKE